MVDALPNLESVYKKWENKAAKFTNKSEQLGKQNGYVLNLNNSAANGRKAWRDKFGDSIQAPPVRRQKYSRDRHRVQNGTLVKSSIIGFYKMAPSSQTLDVRHSDLRPFMGRCCSCMPNSRNAYYDETIPHKGLRNIFNVETKHRSSAWLTRSFCHLSHALQRDMSMKYPDVTLPVLISPRVREAIQKTVMAETEEKSQPKEVLECLKLYERKTVAALKKMKAAISNHLIRFTGWFLHKLLGRLLNNLVVHAGQIDMLKRANQKGIPLIFLPMHKSHLDYILVTFILHNYDIRAPHVAAGDNLYIPFFRSLMRGLGGFFIRRKLDDHNGRKDLVYRAILHTYMQELLRNGQNLEFFIEGGRTRTGKACSPKGGLLSVVVDAFMDETIQDVFIVPVAINYEKILDGNYVTEQMGQPKKKETFWMAVKGIWRVFMSKFGNVRVDFAQPFSLQEYINVSKSYRPSFSSLTPSPPTSASRVLSNLCRCRSNSTIYGTEIVNSDQRQLVKGLAEHVIYSSVQSSAVMSTHLVAFILLTQFREGTDFKTLVRSFKSMKETILFKNHDVGFSGDIEDIVSHAVHLLGSHLVSLTDKKGKSEKIADQKLEDLIVMPVTSLPHVFELSYYANGVSSIFVLESVVVSAVCACSHADILNVAQEDTVSVSRKEVIQKALYLCQILQYEFTFIPPCASLEVALANALEQIISSEILRVEEVQNGYCTREQEWMTRFSSTLAWENSDESDDEYELPDQQLKLNIGSEENKRKLNSLYAVLGSLLETYWVTSYQLPLLLREAKPEEELFKEIRLALVERVDTGVASYAESASVDALKNAVKSYEHMKVVETYLKDGRRMVSLHDNYSTEEATNELITSIQCYR